MSAAVSPSTPDDKPSAGDRAKATAKGLGKEAASIVAGAVGGKVTGAAGKAASGATAAGKAAGAGAAKAGAEKTAATGGKKLASDAASKGTDRLKEAAKRPQSNASTRGGLAGAHDDAKAATKNLAKGVASGALQGATKGGWVGVAIGAAGGAAVGLVDNKAGQRTMLRILAMLAIMSLAVTLLAGALVSATVNAFAATLSSQSQDTAAAAGAEASEIRDARAASERSATPWQLTLWMEREKPDVDFDARAFDAELIRQIPADDDRELIAGAVRDGETGRLKLGDSDVDKAAQETAETGFVAALLALYGPDGTAATVDVATPSTSPTATAAPTAAPAPAPAAPGLDLTTGSSLTVLVNKTTPLNPANYLPAELVPMTSIGVPSANGHSLRSEAATAVKTMFAAATAAGHTLDMTSGYRSFDLQTELYNGYVASLGQEAADLTSAKPGHSEHQTGLAADISAPTEGCVLEACFGGTSAGAWLAANAHEYGFILRYPDGKTGETGYEYEPWHYRYIGVDAAKAYKAANATSYESYTGSGAGTGGATTSPVGVAPSSGPPGQLDEATAKTAFTTAREWALAIGNTCGDEGAAGITAPASGDGSGTVDINGLTSDQVSNVRAIIGATKTMFPTADTRWAGVVAIATAYQESTLVNIGYGDYETGGVLNPDGSPTTSIGLYQQQDSWGTREQRLTPAWATGKFLSVLRAVPGWQTMELAKAAHEVQVYALQHYDKYNQAQPLAEKLWDSYEKTSPAIPLPGDLTGAPGAGAGDGTLPGKSQGGVACAESGTSVGAVSGGVAYPLSLDDPYHQITDFFGPRCCVGSSFHRGVDIQGIEGSAPIFAIAAGTVTESAYGSGAGNYVTVQHDNGVSTSYWHMVGPSPLKVGDKVQAGQQLGTVGDTGSSFGGHLHLETYDQAGEKVNPVTTLKGMGLDLCAYAISGISSKQTCG